MDLLTEIKKLQDTIISYRRSDPAKSYELCEELLALSNEAGND